MPRQVAVLGVISLLTAMSSAMVFGLLPIFLIKVLHSTMATVGFIEGTAEVMASSTKIVSGMTSDWLGRRKPIILVGYVLSAINKLLFPLAADASIVLVARIIDRVGKGVRDAPRDAYLADLTPASIRGSGFGLRLAFYTTGFIIGPLAAVGLMRVSGDDFRLVFWIAVIPAAIGIAVLVLALEESSRPAISRPHSVQIRPRDLRHFSAPFWWAISIASVLSLARVSPAFLVLKANQIGVDPAFVPVMLVPVHVVYAVAAYPFGILADRIERRIQLGIGAVILICAAIVLSLADALWMAACGAALWGLQMAVTQGLLSASVADAAPEPLRGTAFGIYEFTVGVSAFIANIAAGAWWMLGGPELTFSVSGTIAAVALLMCLRGVGS